jgi:hypothetical protein
MKEEAKAIPAGRRSEGIPTLCSRRRNGRIEENSRKGQEQR